MADLENQLHDLQNSSRVGKDDILGWQKKIASLEQALSAAKNKNGRLEAYNAAYDGKMKELNDDLIEANQKIAQLESSLDTCQETIDKKQRDLLDAEKRAANLETANENTSRAKNELQRNLQAAKAKILDLEEDLQAEIKQVAQLKGILGDYKMRNENLKNENARLQKKLLDLQSSTDVSLS